MSISWSSPPAGSTLSGTANLVTEATDTAAVRYRVDAETIDLTTPRILPRLDGGLNLRGFVTVTHHQTALQEYTVADYERMAAQGANCQAIRVLWGLLESFPGAYSATIASLVAKGAEVGFPAFLKLTVYDKSEFANPSTEPEAWGDLWRDAAGEQQALIDAWTTLWNGFDDNPNIIGYDLLNEPKQGDFAGTHANWVETALNPFYRRVIDDLRLIDTEKWALIQPSFGHRPYHVSINRSGVLYAPHFYPNIDAWIANRDHATNGYRALMEQFVSEAATHNAPLYIGEYGMPWNKDDDGDSAKETSYAVMEQVTMDLFAEYGVSYTRPWWANDNAEVAPNFNWALIKGTAADLSGDLREFITAIFAASVGV